MLKQNMLGIHSSYLAINFVDILVKYNFMHKNALWMFNLSITLNINFNVDFADKWFAQSQHSPTSCQKSLSIPPEKIRKRLVFRVFRKRPMVWYRLKTHGQLEPLPKLAWLYWRSGLQSLKLLTWNRFPVVSVFTWNKLLYIGSSHLQKTKAATGGVL